jgi:hypothetical protein
MDLMAGRVDRMAMQLCVLSDDKLNSITEWQKALDAEGFPLQLSNRNSDHNLAARLRDEETSIEYDIHDFKELKAAYRHVNFGSNWTYAIPFTWSSNFAEEIAAWMASTAYARATHGVIFDEQEAKIFTPDESHKIACEIEGRRPEMEAMFKHYVQQLSLRSLEAEVALRNFMQRRLGKQNPT